MASLDIIGVLASARPAERFPDLFGENTFLKQYPYFLACAIPAAFSLLAWLITFFFLKETHPSPVSISQLLNITTKKGNNKRPNSQNGSRSRDTSVDTITSQNGNRSDDDDRSSQLERPLPLRSLLTTRVLLAAGNYGSASFVEIAFRAVQPVFLSTPIILGGLGLPPSSIGTLLSIQGILNGLFQVFFFARIHDRWGSKNTFMAGISCAIPAFVLFPVANALARTQGYGIAVWLVIGLQSIAAISINLSYASLMRCCQRNNVIVALINPINRYNKIIVFILFFLSHFYHSFHQ